MKRNAIIRIVIFTMIALTLTGILVAGLTEDMFGFEISGGIEVNYEASVEAEGTEKIEINWAAGAVRIKRENVDRIIFREVAEGTIQKKMVYRYTGNTLELNYGGKYSSIGSAQEKDLIVIVPLNWSGTSIQINGAALTIDIVDITVDELEMDGADCVLNFQGSVDKVSVDGASAQVKLDCSNRISQIEMDGASCKLDVTLPAGCGFRVDMDGLGCKFNSDLAGIAQNDHYSYGDQQCKIEVDGLSCEVSISAAE
jgi:hypothetical protein